MTAGDEYGDFWRRLTTRWRRGRRLGLVHLLVVPVLIYVLGLVVTEIAPESWLISGAPVSFYLVASALWFVVFIYLLLRDRWYACPRCAARVRPFGGTTMPSYLPHPCPQCGLTAPPPPY